MTDRPVVILMTSNGVGMGHLSRQLTTALSGAHRFDPVIFSLSRALPRIITAVESNELTEAHGRHLRFEYAPSWESGWFPTGWRAPVRRRYRSYRWAPYLRDRIHALAVETGARALIFDGVAPYPGLVAAREALPELQFAWVRRGLWQSQAPSERLNLSRYFDLTIEPGDVAGAWDRGPTRDRTDAIRLDGPVSLTDVLEPLAPTAARLALGLPTERPILLLAPGSGALGSVDATAAEVLTAVRRTHPDWLVAVTRQSIARHSVQGNSDQVVMLDDVYPLARFLGAFDAAVGAAGYNAVHEQLAVGLPTLLIPSTSHVTDDQPTRARGAAERGAALVVEDTIAAAVTRLLDAAEQERLRDGMAQLEAADGGRDIAERVADLAAAGQTAPPWTAVPPSRPLPDLRTRATEGSEGELAWTNQLDRELLAGVRPVEHLLPGSSPAYVQARRTTANWLYRT
ncbi:UDP-N-acetylglucosamine--N-acetylmuramyl-(pentapeptide) pyrophosphoryl-undecaprenol N-acetylglucosamine transferase [Ruania zhangjianzhongii]|uniref:UDP-N-acetylglucosamine--N-acetylmuramyl- (pentapeptide) pyrophosphoryl-undecaprenol N-acetylglucosamine transferase n=1 Tax=Ruania zhangjianzhongii TaxID=2603206 RepID=UPI00143CE687|nr:UDP-N-acetylglucosamine--N-acetylmuramyl-(pentapeptide) pyrophosphoryl-undecaprenol N-acetylglucosamine transferase [Ruania zhangjianzhongii]